MNTSEIEDCIEKFNFSSNIFHGVFPIDLIPCKKLKKPCSLIVNTDKSTGKGKHWVALFLGKHGKLEYFDSFGFRPLNQEIINFIQFNGDDYIYNSKQIQSNRSDTCGKYCVMFILFRSKNINYDTFLNIFKNNKSYNELLINKLFSNLYD